MTTTTHLQGNSELLEIKCRIDTIGDPGVYGHELAALYGLAVAAWTTVRNESGSTRALGKYHYFVAKLRHLLDAGPVPGVIEAASRAGLDAQFRIELMSMSNKEVLAMYEKLQRLARSGRDPFVRHEIAARDEVERRGIWIPGG